MTPRQARVVAEYLTDLNATQAAIRTGYSPKTAKSIGSENLTKPAIAEAIARQQEALARSDNALNPEYISRKLYGVIEENGSDSMPCPYLWQRHVFDSTKSY